MLLLLLACAGSEQAKNTAGAFDTAHTSPEGETGAPPDGDDAVDEAGDDAASTLGEEAADTGLEVEREPPPSVEALDPPTDPAVWVTPATPSPGEEVTVHYRGSLADAATLSMRLGFNGWSESEGREQLHTTTDEGDPVVFEQVATARGEDGVHTATLTMPEGAAALHMTFNDYSDGLVIDDNEGQEYHWGLTFPYIGPYLTWDDERRPGEGVVVTWETSVPCKGVIYFGEGDALDRYAVGESSDTLHHVALTGLSPDTEYGYRVHDNAGRASEVFHFRTPAADQDQITFVVMGDMQDNGQPHERWGEVAGAVARDFGDVDLLLLVGDLAANDYPGFWWVFFDRARELFARVPLVPTIGNHDTPGMHSSEDATSFTRYFPLPAASGDSSYYTLDYGPARFLVLNSERPGELEPGGAQYDFARDALDDTFRGGERQLDWVFAGWHHPPYNAGNRFADVQDLYRPVTELFEGYVDWVFTGHEHLYQRFVPVQYSGEEAPSGGYALGPDDGVGYLVVPSAGDTIWDELVRPEADLLGSRELLAFPEIGESDLRTDAEHGFVVVYASGSTATIDTWAMGYYDDPRDPRLQESLTYTRQ
jgi:hypothetical protein